MPKRLSGVLSLLLLCLAPASLEGAGSPAASAPRPPSGRLLRDMSGRTVRVPTSPKRLVSLAPSVTESVFAIGAGDRVVGVTDFCDFPAAARSLPRIGGMVNPNWEIIVNLRPDLLLATTAGNDREVAARADALGLPVFFLQTPDIPSVLESLTVLGNLLGARERADSVRAGLASRLQRLDALPGPSPRPSVLFLVWGDPIVVPGRGTFLDDALRRAGCDSVTSSGPPGWPIYNLETILERNPRWILATDQNAAFLRSLRRRPGWKDLDAVRAGRVATVDMTLERPAPRVVEALEHLRRLLEREPK